MARFATVPAQADPPLGSATAPGDSRHSPDIHNGADYMGNSTSGEHDTDNDGPGKKKKGTKNLNQKEQQLEWKSKSDTTKETQKDKSVQRKGVRVCERASSRESRRYSTWYRGIKSSTHLLSSCSQYW